MRGMQCWSVFKLHRRSVTIDIDSQLGTLNVGERKRNVVENAFFYPRENFGNMIRDRFRDLPLGFNFVRSSVFTACSAHLWILLLRLGRNNMQSSASSSLPHRRSGSSLQLGGASRVLASGADAATADVSTRVRVVARLRPFLADEIKRKEPQCVFVEDKSVLGDRVVKLVESSENSFGEKTCIESQYRYDGVMDVVYPALYWFMYT